MVFVVEEYLDFRDSISPSSKCALGFGRNAGSDTVTQLGDL